MSRLVFEKTGNAVWISHLDLMRVMQRSFRRAGLMLKHTGGFNQHAYVALALPLSVGTESRCEILDFDLAEPCPPEELPERLNRVLPEGICVLTAYEKGEKFGKLARLHVKACAEYDGGIPMGAEAALTELFRRETLTVEKQGKNGPVPVDLKPMIFSMELLRLDGKTLLMDCVISAQNPTMNPMQLGQAIGKYLPEFRPDFFRCSRVEVLREDGTVFR